MLYLGVSALEFEKSAPSSLSNCKILLKKNMPNLGPKMAYLGIFDIEFQ